MGAARALFRGSSRGLPIASIEDGVGGSISPCEFTNLVHSYFTPELLGSLAKQGIPWEVLQAARKPVSEAHNRQETPLFAKSIERHALNTNTAATANA